MTERIGETEKERTYMKMCDHVLLEPVTGTKWTVSQSTKINFVLNSLSLDPMFLMSPWRESSVKQNQKTLPLVFHWIFPEPPPGGVSLL